MKTSLVYVALSLFAAGFAIGWAAHVQWVAGDNIEALTEANEIRIELGGAVAETAVETEREDAEVRVIYKTIEREVTRYVERDPDSNTVCLNDTALGLLNAAGRGKRVPIDPGQPDPALP